MHSKDICGQNRTLSYITPNFKRFSLTNFEGVVPQKLYPGYHSHLAACQVTKFQQLFLLPMKL